MGQFFNSLTDELVEFIRLQPMFFVASATADSRVNLSPKGLDTFRVFGAHRVGYLDLTGSGNETAGHLLHDGRLTIMFCSFGPKPRILRLWGKGHVVRPGDAEWSSLGGAFPTFPGTRQMVVLNVAGVQTSCGFGVPAMTLAGQRTMLTDWAEQKGADGIADYWRKKNSHTVDGLPTGLGTTANARP